MRKIGYLNQPAKSVTFTKGPFSPKYKSGSHFEFRTGVSGSSQSDATGSFRNQSHRCLHLRHAYSSMALLHVYLQEQLFKQRVKAPVGLVVFLPVVNGILKKSRLTVCDNHKNPGHSPFTEMQHTKLMASFLSLVCSHAALHITAYIEVLFNTTKNECFDGRPCLWTGLELSVTYLVVITVTIDLCLPGNLIEITGTACRFHR